MNPVRNFASGVRKERKDIMLQKQISNGVKKTAITAITLLAMLLTGCVYLGPRSSVFNESLPTNTSTGKPQFTAETINVRTDSSTATMLKISVNIPVTELIFQKVNGEYQAKYSIEFRSQHEDSTIEYQAFNNIISALPYAQLTDNVNKSFLYSISYAGKPGSYMLDIKVTDNVAGKSDNLQIPATIIRLSPEFDISDLILIKNIDLINTVRAISRLAPLNPSALSSWQDPVYAFEIYYSDKTDTTSIPIIIEYELRHNAELILKKQFSINSVTAKKDIIGIQISLPDEIQGGLYQSVLTAHILNPKTNEVELTSRRAVKTIRFSSPIPRSIRAMEKMVEPLIYFIPPPYHMMKNFKKAKTMQKKAQILDNFWQTNGDDVMEAFYARVEYANKNYRGWRTDMGRVYTKFGPPMAGKDIFTIPGAISPVKFEVWHYPNYDAAHEYYFPISDVYYKYKVFIFVDRFGTNDFDFGQGGYSELSGHNTHEFSSTIKLW